MRLLCRMSKWTKPRRDPGRTYIDEDKRQRRERMLARLARFIEQAVPEGEADFVAALKEARPEISAKDLREAITQFHGRDLRAATARSKTSLNRFSDSRSSFRFIFFAPSSICSPTVSRRASVASCGCVFELFIWRSSQALFHLQFTSCSGAARMPSAQARITNVSPNFGFLLPADFTLFYAENDASAAIWAGHRAIA